MEAVLIVGIVFGSGTAIVAMAIDKFAGGKNKAHQLEMERERAALQSQRIQDLERMNDQLSKQVEWHERLATAEARKSLSEPSTGQALPPSRN